MSEYLGFEPTKSSDYYFVSYNSEDVKRISPIVKQIAADGVPLWYDYDLEYGAAWKRQITERIQNSQAVILFFTKGIFAKEESYVQTEYEIAVFLEKKIYVVIMDDITKKDVPIQFVTWYLEVTDHHCVKVTRAKTTVEQVGIIEKAIGHVPVAATAGNYLRDVDNTVATSFSEKPSQQEKSFSDRKTTIEPMSSAPVAPVLPMQVEPYSEGLKFSRLGDRACIVSGIGNCKDTNVRIPPIAPGGGKVTAIGSMTFRYCIDLVSVTIPDSVTSIGKYAFSYCAGLPSITIPDSVTSIGRGAFSNCTSLTSVTIPDSVTSIGDRTFWDCDRLTSVTLPDSVTSIGDRTFFGCTNLALVTIPDSVTSIGQCAFAFCAHLNSVIIPDSVTSIGQEAFLYCHELTIYCAHPQRPADWDENWNPDNRPVIWNYKG